MHKSLVYADYSTIITMIMTLSLVSLESWDACLDLTVRYRNSLVV